MTGEPLVPSKAAVAASVAWIISSKVHEGFMVDLVKGGVGRTYQTNKAREEESGGWASHYFNAERSLQSGTESV